MTIPKIIAQNTPNKILKVQVVSEKTMLGI